MIFLPDKMPFLRVSLFGHVFRALLFGEGSSGSVALVRELSNLGISNENSRVDQCAFVTDDNREYSHAV